MFKAPSSSDNHNQSILNHLITSASSCCQQHTGPSIVLLTNSAFKINNLVIRINLS